MDITTWAQISSIKAKVLSTASSLVDKGITREAAAIELEEAILDLHFLEDECKQTMKTGIDLRDGGVKQ
jgi:hypothetical protein